MSGRRPVAALDVGGTTIKGTIVAPDGTMSDGLVWSTRAELGPDAVVTTIVDAARELVASGAEAVGVVVPGMVIDGVARYSANLGWRDVPLQRLLIERLGVPAIIEHDVRAAGLAEAAASGHDDLMLVVIGTGIANATVIGGQVVRGSTSGAGEIGHVPVHPAGEACGCGQRGCLEVYASGAGIARRYADAGGTVGDAAAISAALASDPLAARIWREAVEALALALATATLLLDPARIVLAGGVAAAGERLSVPTVEALRGLLAWRAAPVVEISALGADAGLRGAALLASSLASSR